MKTKFIVEVYSNEFSDGQSDPRPELWARTAWNVGQEELHYEPIVENMINQLGLVPWVKPVYKAILNANQSRMIKYHVHVDPHLNIHQVKKQEPPYHLPEIKLLYFLPIYPHLSARLYPHHSFLNAADGVGYEVAILALAFSVLGLLN